MRNSNIPWPRRPWGFGGPSYPRGWKYGLMLPRRTLRSIAYLPKPRDRMALGRNKIPFWHIINYDLTSQQSQDGNAVPVHNFTLISIMGTSSREGGQAPPLSAARTQFFQLTDTAGHGMRFSTVGVNFPNAVGKATNPFIIKRPYPMPNLLALLNRTANQIAAAGQDAGGNLVQIALYGVRDMDFPGE